jgi:hypothetical protein
MANRPSLDAVRPEPERLRGRASMGRGFTLLEIMIVMGVILILTSLVLGVGSALLKRAERAQVESAMTIMESAFSEWEAQTGRPVSYVATGDPIYTSADQIKWFDVRDSDAGGSIAEFSTSHLPGTASGVAATIARARGAGVYCVNLFSQADFARPIIAGIAPSLLRIETGTTKWPAMVTGYRPSYRPLSGNESGAGRAELVDAWGARIAFVFPGRQFRWGVDPGNPDEDGSVRTDVENKLGVCANGRVCLVSAGPDGLFGPEASGLAAEAAASDNVYLYELLPPTTNP